MSWDRKGKHAYFYTSVRKDGCIRKLYVGLGPAADAQAHEIEQRRQARAAEREARQRSEAEVILAAQKTSELRALTAAVVHAVLDGAGYHIHRGQVRRRRCLRF
jgi:tRNA U55 pseudouridine synthase TruB